MSTGGGERTGGPDPGDLETGPRDEARRSNKRDVMERVLDEVDRELGQEGFECC